MLEEALGKNGSDMKRNLSGWGVTTAGLLLAGVGAYAMLAGWDIILLERGWSLFIAGSVAVSSGVVTMALGRVVAHISALGAKLDASAPLEPHEVEEGAADALAVPPPAPGVASPPLPAAPFPPRPPHYAPAASPDPLAMLAAAHAHAQSQEHAQQQEEGEGQLVEVDRYSAGDATYIMLSDGSVEVISPVGAQRYPSLAALRAEAELQQR